MKKRIIALLLVLVSAVAVLSGCAGSIDADSEYKGQQITMYLTENIYNLDPAEAYTNEASRSIVNLLFDTLFTVDENGKVKESLAKSYTTEKTDDGELLMHITIKEDARWSDNQNVTADDVVYAWKRILNPNNSYDCAALLFDIKNARAYNEAEVSKDDVGLTADGKLLTIEFEKEIDYDQFLLNLTSLALAPLREDIASKNADWAKKPGIMTSSGPFKLSKIGFYKNGEVAYEDINYSIKDVDENNKVKLDKNGNPIYIPATTPSEFAEQRVHSYILERNLYYYRNAEDGEKLDVSVTPYRIIVDCSLNDEELLDAYNKGIIAYIDDIPMSIRSNVKDKAYTYDSLSTNVIYLNENAEIVRDTGKKDDEGNAITENVKLFADKTVRQALSMAIDREAIAEALVFAEVATGLVPTGVYDCNMRSKSLFRDASTSTFKYLSKDLDAAASALAEAKITPAEYTFSITIPCYDEAYLFIANAVASAWGKDGLGFNVEVKVRGTIANNDYHKDVASIPSDLCDDLWAEDIKNGLYDATILDLVAPSADPFSVLAPFAKQFSGQKMDMSNSESYELSPHATGYQSDAYDEIMEKIYNNKKIEARSSDLHKAEEILMDDMPVIPIVFNKSAHLINTDLLNVKDSVILKNMADEYYYPVIFDKVTVKDYEGYELKCAKFVYERFDELKKNAASYFSTFADLSKEEFVYTNSNYFYLFKDKCVVTIERAKDDRGNLIYETDADGELATEVNSKGEVVTDKEGKPRKVVKEIQVVTYVEGYEWMPKNPKLATEAEDETEETTEKVTEAEETETTQG